MADQNHARWLAAELPDLVARGVLDAAAAGRLRAHYAAMVEAAPSRSGVAVRVALVLAGIVLVGWGVFLAVARTWHDLPPRLRVGLAAAFLLAAQGIAFHALQARRGSPAWREAAAALLTTAVGTWLGVVGITYATGGEVHEWLLAWWLLAVPLVLLFDSGLVAVASMVGALAWGLSRGIHLHEHLHAALPLLLLPGVAHAGSVWRRRGGDLAARLQAWATVLVLGPAGVISLPGDAPLWLLANAAYVTALHIACRELDARAAVRPAPLAPLGVLPAAVCLLFFGIESIWPHSSRMAEWFRGHDAGAWLLAAGYMLAAIAAIVLGARRALADTLLCATPLLVAIAGVFLLAADLGRETAATLASLAAIGFGVGGLLRGLQTGSLLRVNGGIGMAALALLVLTSQRTQEPVLIGLILAACGAALLITNLVLRRRQRT
ncbi:MAG: DUF2157 domain-containing protein [Planctomycetes bacterium]|nr:DUF2157 domain-containing protein [Planctomycetota bacterium]